MAWQREGVQRWRGRLSAIKRQPERWARGMGGEEMGVRGMRANSCGGDGKKGGVGFYKTVK